MQHDIQDSVERVALATEEKIESTVDAARDSIVSTIRPAKDGLQSFAERQKAIGADQIGSVARATHRAADEMEKELPGVARSMHDAAGRLDTASESLRGQSIEELVSSFREIARKRPGVVLGGAVLAGFAFSRFLKASAAHI